MCITDVPFRYIRVYNAVDLGRDGEGYINLKNTNDPRLAHIFPFCRRGIILVQHRSAVEL